mgnify:CR=1 FL=1
METKTKESFLEELIALSNTENVLSVGREVSELNVKFNDFLIEEERLRQVDLLTREEAGEKVNWQDKVSDPIQDQFKEILQVFLTKKKAIIDEKKEIEDNNLKAKKSVLSQLKELIQNEENIGKAFSTKKELNEKWKSVGAVPRGKDQDLNAEYFRLNEEFNYNINIYKELKDHDYKKNGILKNELIEKLALLKNEKHIKTLENQLRALQGEWNEIGPVSQDLWEDFKERYWVNVKALYEVISLHYDEQKVKRAENVEKKKVLLQAIEENTSVELASHKEWDAQTKIILGLQEEWKNSGRGTKEEDDELWNKMRAFCNSFFDRKKEFYEARKGDFDQLKAKKEVLIKEVEAMKDSTEWKDTTLKIIAIQKQWKKIGSAGPKNENKLWKEFRVHCDHFFNAKDAHFKKEEDAYQDNLAKKQEIIETISKYKVDAADVKGTIDQLKQFSAQFNEVGNVPRDQKDEIYKAYKSALNAHYENLNLEKDEQAKVMYQAKIDTLQASPDSHKLLNKERSDLRNQISKLEKEIIQLENNLGFFGNSKGANPLKEQVEKNIEQTRVKIDGLKKQLKLIPKSE